MCLIKCPEICPEEGLVLSITCVMYLKWVILHQCDKHADCIVRLPMFYGLTLDDVDRIISCINCFTVR